MQPGKTPQPAEERQSLLLVDCMSDCSSNLFKMNNYCFCQCVHICSRHFVTEVKHASKKKKKKRKKVLHKPFESVAYFMV